MKEKKTTGFIPTYQPLNAITGAGDGSVTKVTTAFAEDMNLVSSTRYQVAHRTLVTPAAGAS